MKKILVFVCALVLVAGVAQAKQKTPVTDGEFKAFYPSGTLMKIENYRLEELHGKVLEYYQNGSLKSVATYRMGKRFGEAKTFYETGIVKTEGVYVDDELQGIFKTYNKEGGLEKSETYDRGVLNGEAKIYYPSGALKRQMVYRKSVLDGMLIEFYENGQMKLQETYIKGTLDNKKTFDPVGDFIAQDKTRALREKADEELAAAKKIEKKAMKDGKPVEGEQEEAAAAPADGQPEANAPAGEAK